MINQNKCSREEIKMLFERNTVIYEKDIEAMGGGVMLEKMIKKGFFRNLYQGIMYLKGRRYRIKIMTYPRGKGKIVEIALPGDKNAEVQYLIEAYETALKNNEGGLYRIRQSRKVTNYLSAVCITMQVYLIITNVYRMFYGTFDYGNVLIVILCTVLIPLTLIKKERSLRL